MRIYFYNQRDICWKLPSRERLFKRLGEYDTMAEFTVLAERHFESLCNKATSFSDFVNQKADEYDVKIRNGVSLENYSEALYKSFMINSHAIFYDFIENFKNDMRVYIKHDFELIGKPNNSLYERLLKSMFTAGFNPPIPQWLNDIALYYRMVRNCVAHNNNDETKCVNVYSQIDLKQMCKDYPLFTNKAPNPPGKITMDDFYLYSASIKHIANLLTISIQGFEKWEDIGLYHPELQLNSIPKGTDKRKLIGQIMNKLGHRCTDNEIGNILKKMMLQDVIH